MSSSRHIRRNKNYKFSSLVLDEGARTRTIERRAATKKLAEGEELSDKEKKQLRAHLTKHASYNQFGSASLVGMHWNAVKAFIATGDKSQLEKLIADYGDKEGRLVIHYGKPDTRPGRKGKMKSVVLETNTAYLQGYADYGLFEANQELDLGQVMSSNWAIK